MPNVFVSSVFDIFTLSEWNALLLALGERTMRLLVILALTWALLDLLHRLLPRALQAALIRERHGTESEARRRYETLTAVSVRTLQVVLLGIAAVMAMQEVGFNVAPLVAGLSVIGIAVGFGTQSLVRDVVSGIFILAEDQFHKGDIVRIGTLQGTVEDVNLRRTVLRDLDGTLHSIPNGLVTISSNFTREWVRANVDVRLRYNADLTRAQALVDGVGDEMMKDADVHPALIAAPHWERIEALEENWIVVRVTATVRPRRQLEVAGEMRRRLMQALMSEGMLFAGPAPLAAPEAAVAAIPLPAGQPAREGVERREVPPSPGGAQG